MQFLGLDNYSAAESFCPVIRMHHRPPLRKFVLREGMPIEWAARKPDWADKVTFLVVTPEGEVEISPGAWLVEGSAGEYYPVRDDIFQSTFTAAEGCDPRDSA